MPSPNLNHRPKRLNLNVGEELCALFKTMCEIENLTTADGFKQAVYPWFKQVLNDLYLKPDSDLLLLGEVEVQLNEIFAPM